jgi:hypothetical protein
MPFEACIWLFGSEAFFSFLQARARRNLEAHKKLAEAHNSLRRRKEKEERVGKVIQVSL